MDITLYLLSASSTRNISWDSKMYLQETMAYTSHCTY